MEPLRIEYVPIDSIKPYERNANWSVYVHTFPNGKKYIGITSQCPERRWRDDGSGYKSQQMFMRAIKKYGWDNVIHEILHEGLTEEEAASKEKEYIAKYKTANRKNGYNIEPGGNNAKGYKLSKETRKKMSISRSGSGNPNYGKTASKETREKQRLAHLGKKDIEAIRRGARKRMGANAYNARKVCRYGIDGKFIKVYDSLADAGRDTNTRPQDIYNCCIGRQNKTHGNVWRYYCD